MYSCVSAGVGGDWASALNGAHNEDSCRRESVLPRAPMRVWSSEACAILPVGHSMRCMCNLWVECVVHIPHQSNLHKLYMERRTWKNVQSTGFRRKKILFDPENGFPL